MLDPLRKSRARLRVVMEHITTKDGAEYVQANPERLGATITVQHLMLDRNDMLVGGMRPHYYCLPILKRSTHQDALVERGDQRRSALLPRHRQRAAPDRPEGERLRLRGGVLRAQCAGVPGPDVRRRRGKLDRLEGFVSRHWRGASMVCLTNTSTLQRWTRRDAPQTGASSRSSWARRP